jgi:hypothetical protein
MTDQNNSFMNWVLNVLKTEGLKGVSKRIKDRLRVSEIHLFVISSQPGTVSESSTSLTTYVG